MTAALQGLFAAMCLLFFPALAGAQGFHIAGTTAVGVSTGPQHVTVKLQQTGTLASVKVVTQGITGLDFSDAGTGTCVNGLYLGGQTCTVDVVFTPGAPGRRKGAAVLIGSQGEVLGLTLMDGTGTGPIAVIRPGMAESLAGTNDYGYNGDNQPANISSLYSPYDVLTTPTGDVVFADGVNGRIRLISASNGYITTIAGGGNAVRTDGPATQSMLSLPRGLAMDGAGNLYVSEQYNNAVRRVDAVTGQLTRFAGTYENGFSGANVAATSAKLSQPAGIALDRDGNLYIADMGNNAIRRVDTSGNITTYAGGNNPGLAGDYSGDGGPATAAHLNQPKAVAFAPDGTTLYIADSGNNVVRKIDTTATTPTIQLVAGTGAANFGGDGGAATGAQLQVPSGLTFDPQGNLYIADTANNRIRRVDGTSGIIITVAGTGAPIFNGDGLNADAASFKSPYGIFFDAMGNVLIGDLQNNHIRRIRSNFALFSYPVMKVGKKSTPQMETVENDGNADLHLTMPPATADQDQSALDSASTTCSAAAMSPDANCLLGVQFAPTRVSQSDTDTIIGSLTLRSDAVNTPDKIQVSGHVLSVEPTNLTLTSNINPASPGQAVTFTATVSTQAATLTGEVDFYEGTNQIGSAQLGPTIQSGSGSNLRTVATAAISLSNLSVGDHTITAKYQSDDNNAASNTGSMVETILQPTQVALQSSANPSTVTHNVTFTATVTPTTGSTAITTGTFTFTDSDSGTLCAAVAVNGSGTATCTTNNLRATEGSANPVISHTITAAFSGTSAVAASSAQLNQVVNRSQTSTMLSVNPTTITVGGTVTMQATVTGNNGLTPTGSVGFYSSTSATVFTGAKLLGNAAVDGSGIATLPTTALSPGMNYIHAEYAGDSQNGLSSSTPGIGVQVNKLITTTTVTSTVNPADVGTSVTIIANVAPNPNQPANGALTGTITLYDNGVQMGVPQSIASGAVSITSTSLTVGTHPITAVYAESDIALGSSTAQPYNQVIQQATSRIALTLSATNTVAGKPLSMTASIAGSGALRAGGSIVFTADGNPIGQAVMNAQASASFTTTTLPVGTHSIVATFVGDSNFTAGQSAPASMTVRIGNTALTLASSAAQITAGSSVTLGGALTGDGVLPASATVSLTDNGAPLTTVTPNGSGAYAYSTGSLTVGTHTIVATYAGDSNNAAATSQQVVVTVVQAKTSTALTTSKTPATVGDNVTFQVKVASSLANATGTVTFSDGATVLATVPLSTTSDAVFSTANLAIGAHTITATFSGDTTHSGSAAAPLQQMVVQGTSVTMASSSNPSIAGLPVDFAIQVTPNVAANGSALPVPTGTVNVLDGANPLGTLSLNSNGAATLHATALTVGTHNLTVTYVGDVNFQTSTSAVLVQVVKSADTHATLTASASQISLGTSLALNVAVTGNGDVPTGTITFLDGGTAIGQVPLSAGTAAFATTTLSPGMHTLSASYGGDSNNSPTIAAPVQVQVQQTSSVILASSSNPALTLESFTLTASVHNSVAPMATGTVQFTEGSAVLGTASVDGSGNAVLKVGPFPAGVHNIVASYSGDVADYASASVPLAVTVNLRPTTTAVTATAATKASGGQLSLIAAIQYSGPVVPTGSMTFKIGSTVLGSARVDGAGVSTFTITTSVLPASVTAVYSGDTVYSGSTSGVTVVPKDDDATDFTITVDPIAVTVQTKKFAIARIAIHSLGGFSDTLSLGCLGLPYAATCTFDKDQVTLDADGTITVNVTVDTGSPLTSGGQTIQQKAALQTSSKAALCALPAGALCALLLLRSRRRTHMASLLLLLVLAVLVLPMGGCGSIDVVSTPPGGYSFKISAAGKASGVTVSQPVNLTVTQ